MAKPCTVINPAPPPQLCLLGFFQGIANNKAPPWRPRYVHRAHSTKLALARTPSTVRQGKGELELELELELEPEYDQHDIA